MGYKLSQPSFGILRCSALPDLEMKLRYSVDRIDSADDFTCLDLVSGLYVA